VERVKEHYSPGTTDAEARQFVKSFHQDVYEPHVVNANPGVVWLVDIEGRLHKYRGKFLIRFCKSNLTCLQSWLLKGAHNSIVEGMHAFGLLDFPTSGS
jgi:hypothetical protein